MGRCVRCRQKINPNESAYIALLDKRAGKLEYRIERAAKAQADIYVIHLNGDPQCGKEVSGFRLQLLKSLGLSDEVDTEFLDYV